MRFLIFAMASSVLMGCGGEKCDRSGFICTFAGVPQEAQFGKEDVPAVESQLYLPQDIVFADDGTAYFPDFNNHRIRTIGVDGIVHSVAGTGFLGDGPEGPAEVFAWNHPTNLAIDPSNPSLIYIAAWHNSRINVLDLDAETVTFECGTGGRDFAGDGGDALMAVLDLPSSVAFDRDGNLYISDQANQAIRKVDPLGVIETIAGSPGSPNAAEINKDPALEPVEDATTGYAGDGGPAEDALLFAETGQQADPSSKLTIHRDTLYLADSGNNVVRAIDLKTMEIRLVAGIPWHRNGELPSAKDPTTGDGGDALDAYLNNPRDVAVGIDGELYIADTDNHCIRVVDTDGVIDTFAGECGTEPKPKDGFLGEEEKASKARFHSPYGIATDALGNVYVADTKNHVIRRIAY